VCREYAHRLGIDSQSLMMEYVQARFKKPQPEYLRGAEQLLDALKKKGAKVYA
jgi:phosphoserine phosphatase